MNKDEITQYLKDNLVIRADFQRYTYGGTNQLNIRLLLDDIVISECETTIDPTEDKNYY